jgi:hypothetical protein
MNLSTIAISEIELQKETNLKTETCPSNEKHTCKNDEAVDRAYSTGHYPINLDPAYFCS